MALAQTSAVENYETRIKVAGEFKVSSDALLSELLACVATDAPATKIKALEEQLKQVKATKELFTAQHHLINARIAEIKSKQAANAATIAFIDKKIPRAQDFAAVSEKMQTEKQYGQIADVNVKEFSLRGRDILESINRNVRISFTDSQGRRRLANAAEASKLDAEQRAVLEAVTLSWFAAPMALVQHQRPANFSVDAKNKERVQKVTPESLADSDAKAFAEGANSMIPKANILVESRNAGFGLNKLGRDIQERATTLARALPTDDVSPATVQAELSDRAFVFKKTDSDKALIIKENASLQTELERQNEDSKAFFERMVNSDATIKRLELEFKNCEKKLAPAKSLATKSESTVKRDLIDEDAKAYERLKAKKAEEKAHKAE
jgi:hypothetical protein